MKLHIPGMPKPVLDRKKSNLGRLTYGACSTPLHSAFRERSEEVINILLEAGADPTIACIGWVSLLHFVSSYSDPLVGHFTELA